MRVAEQRCRYDGTTARPCTTVTLPMRSTVVADPRGSQTSSVSRITRSPVAVWPTLMT